LKLFTTSDKFLLRVAGGIICRCAAGCANGNWTELSLVTYRMETKDQKWELCMGSSLDLMTCRCVSHLQTQHLLSLLFLFSDGRKTKIYIWSGGLNF